LDALDPPPRAGTAPASDDAAIDAAIDAGFEVFAARGLLPGWRETGRGRPLLLLHGWSVPGTVFAGQAALARLGWRVIAPDHAGHGLSRGLPGAAQAGIARLAEDTAALIRHLGLEDVVVVGWSMGAMVAWHLMQDHPGLPLAAVGAIDMTPRLLTGPDWPHGLRGGYDAEMAEQMAARVQRDWPALAPAVAAELWADGQPPVRGQAHQAALSALVAHGQRQCDPAALAALWQDMARQDLRQVLRDARLPVLLLHGECSRLYGPAVAAAVAALQPAALRCTIDGAGHSPHLEQPAAFNAALLALLEKAEAGRSGEQPVGPQAGCGQQQRAAQVRQQM